MPQILEIPSYFQLSALHKAEIISLFSELLGQPKDRSNFNQTHMVETAGFTFFLFLRAVFFAFINFLGTVASWIVTALMLVSSILNLADQLITCRA